MRKNIPGTGTFRPYRPAPGFDARNLVTSVLRNQLNGEFCRLLADIRNIEVLGLEANKTGRRIVVRARVDGRVTRLSIAPYEGRDCSQRTKEGVLNELIEILAGRPVRGGMSLLQAVSSADGIKDANPDVNIGHAVILTVLFQEVKGGMSYPLDGGVARLHEAVTQFVFGGRHIGNFDAHQRTKALENFRASALHAMKHGAAQSDLLQALMEETVRATLEH